MSIVQFGLSNVHYAVITKGEDGSYSYGTPEPILGAVTLSISPEGSSSNFYADNGIFYSTSSNSGYSGTLTIAKLTEKFRTDVLGEKLVAGGLLESSNDRAKEVALLFQVENDVANDKIVYYDAVIARPTSNANSTTDTTDVSTQDLTITFRPRKTDRAIRWATGEATTPEVHASFFTTVQTPELLSAEVI